MRRLWVLIFLATLAPCTDGKNVSVSTPQSSAPQPTAPSPTISKVKCSGLPATIEGEDGDLQCASSASGDLDGDGALDTFALYLRVGPGIQVEEFVATAMMGDGREIRELKLDPNEAAAGPERVKVLGLADANGDERDEAFYVYEGGASVDFGSIVVLQGSRLVRVRSGSRPFAFGLSGSVMRGNGLECVTQTRKLVLRSAYTDDEGKTFSISETEYRWSGTTSLFYRARRTGSNPGDDPDIRRFWQLRCGKLRTEH